MTEQTMRQNLFVIAQAYAEATGLSITTVSKKIHGNGDFFAGFLAGTLSCGVDTYFNLVNRFRARWPKNTPWPKTAGIPKLGKKLDDGFVDG
jgi:hypothetical protein